MHLHILGICGTFMGGIAALARAAGHRVTGSDRNVYPPMSTQLAALGIDVIEGYEADQLELRPDVFVVGNVMSRGNAAGRGDPRQRPAATSRARNGWRATCCTERWVLGVAGTHGKTTTTSLLAWILEHAGLEPGFLVGGVPLDFGVSARLGAGRHFVVEADEYDTAFFDKRAKFVHYRPRTAILNNLEHDHADIYPDVASIQRQFHLLLRTVPGNGRLVVNAADRHLAEVLAMGCWTPVERFTADAARADGLARRGRSGVGLRAIHGAARRAAGRRGRVEHARPPQRRERARGDRGGARTPACDEQAALEALRRFGGVRRRLEVRGTVGGVVRLRRLRAPPDGDRDDARGRAPQGGQRPRHRRARAALEHDEARHAQGRAGGVAARRGPRVRLPVAGSALGRGRGHAAARRAGRRARRPGAAHGGARRARRGPATTWC